MSALAQAQAQAHDAAGADPPHAAHGGLVLTTAGDVDKLVRARGAFFLVTDRNGDIHPAGARELGLFDRDTRYLSHYALRIQGSRLVRLSADAEGDAFNQIDLMLARGGDVSTLLDDPENFLHVRRHQLLDRGMIERIDLTNYLTRPLDLRVEIDFGVDFADIFEVRGAERARRGTIRPPRIDDGRIVVSYVGICGNVYAADIVFAPIPSELVADRAAFNLHLAPGESTTLEVRVMPRRDGASPGHAEAPRKVIAEVAEEAAAFREASSTWWSDDAPLRTVLRRATADLRALQIHFGEHIILGAGIPWFCAPFGRDALLASYEALLLNPDLARDALRTLAAFQGKKYDDATEEEPGKIFHELRFGEMALTREIPHRPYYGSVDATPLFVIVADAHHRFAADASFLEELRPALLDALGWIDARSENGTRLVAYERRAAHGLDNQGWKDSRGGVSFPNGTPAEPPIALIEVQGYCVDAYARGARILRVLGEEALAATYARRAAEMGALVEERLWLKDAQRYAFAIDGRGRALDTVVSNVGHLMWSGVASQERAEKTAALLLAPSSFSGFGIRTLAAGQRVYNPLSYHNGTVWPHDNALCARGFARYDLSAAAKTVFEGLYDALPHFNDHRLPELFCGMPRASGPLVRYPVACSPQAWASAAPFLLLQSMLGIHADAPQRRLVIRNPSLPPHFHKLEIGQLRIGASRVRVRFRRVGKLCHVDELEVTGTPLKTELEIG